MRNVRVTETGRGKKYSSINIFKVHMHSAENNGGVMFTLAVPMETVFAGEMYLETAIKVCYNESQGANRFNDT